MVRDQLGWTSKCYRQALLDLYGHLLSEEEKHHTDVRELQVAIANKADIDLANWPLELNEIYLYHLRKLDTNKLELIVEAYKKGKQYRSPLTIDVLLSELFDRSTNSETKT